MKTWRDMLEKVLMGSKYIWDPLPQALNPAEMFGADDQMGYLDHLAEFISEVEKKAFMAGFSGGVSEVLKEYAEFLGVEPKPDMVVNQITAERKYLAWRE